MGEKLIFPTLSNGEEIVNPRFYHPEELRLAKEQKKLSKLPKGTKERGKVGKVVSTIDEYISNKRRDFCHKESKKIVDNYQYICIEDLNIPKRVEGSYLVKSIMDASWNQFYQFLTYKAEKRVRPGER